MIETIRRTRGFYLYSESGRRYLDLSLDGGGAFCGHRPHTLTTGIKQVLSRGGMSLLPNRAGVRAEKVLWQLWAGLGLGSPSQKVLSQRDSSQGDPSQSDPQQYQLVYFPPGTPPAMLPALLSIPEGTIAEAWDAASAETAALSPDRSVLIVRPAYSFAEMPAIPPQPYAAVVPVLPVPKGLAPLPVFVRRDYADPAVHGITGAIEFPAEIGMYTVVRGAHYFMEPRYPGFSPKRSDCIFRPRGVQERRWPGWVSRGPYQYSRLNPAGYQSWRRKALQAGILLPQLADEPAIMPAVITIKEDEILDSLANLT